jgi:hydrogenase maturation protease
MTDPKVRCLILACGNTLRSDDGIGPELCSWAQQHFATNPSVRAISDHQWTPEIAEEIASAETVLFIDCSLDCAPGQIILREIQPAPLVPGLVTHHVGAPELLAITRDLYNAAPSKALQFTMGAGSIELGEGLSPQVQAALPDAMALLELAIQQCLRT